jgi:hypothetical protein
MRRAPIAREETGLSSDNPRQDPLKMITDVYDSTSKIAIVLIGILR